MATPRRAKRLNYLSIYRALRGGWDSTAGLAVSPALVRHLLDRLGWLDYLFISGPSRAATARGTGGGEGATLLCLSATSNKSRGPRVSRPVASRPAILRARRQFAMRKSRSANYSPDGRSVGDVSLKLRFDWTCSCHCHAATPTHRVSVAELMLRSAPSHASALSALMSDIIAIHLQRLTGTVKQDE